MSGESRRPRPMVEALARGMVAAHHASVADLYIRQAKALHFAITMLRPWWDRPGVTLRDALAAAPPELAETVLARLREVGFTVD